MAGWRMTVHGDRTGHCFDERSDPRLHGFPRSRAFESVDQGNEPEQSAAFIRIFANGDTASRGPTRSLNPG